MEKVRPTGATQPGSPQATEDAQAKATDKVWTWIAAAPAFVISILGIVGLSKDGENAMTRAVASQPWPMLAAAIALAVAVLLGARAVYLQAAGNPARSHWVVTLSLGLIALSVVITGWVYVEVLKSPDTPMLSLTTTKEGDQQVIDLHVKASEIPAGNYASVAVFGIEFGRSDRQPRIASPIDLGNGWDVRLESLYSSYFGANPDGSFALSLKIPFQPDRYTSVFVVAEYNTRPKPVSVPDTETVVEQPESTSAEPPGPVTGGGPAATRVTEPPKLQPCGTRSDETQSCAVLQIRPL